MGLIDCFIHGQVDWEYVHGKMREYCPILSGALFGAGWWCWIDAIVFSMAVLQDKIPVTYHIPGWVATLALILMNLVSRDDLAAAGDAFEEGAEFRARCWLFFAYVVATGAIAGSVAVLIVCCQQQQHIQAGLGSLLQSGLVISSGLLLWAFRTEEPEGYGYIG